MNDDELRLWRKAGDVAARARDLGVRMVEEGTTYLEVAEAVEDYIHEKNALIAFPINIAVNDIAAHYTPKTGDRLRFNYGDVVKVDVGAHIDGRIGDTARTVEVGSNVYGDLIEASRRALEAAMEIIRGGISLSTIGSVVERTMNTMGFRPIVNLTGHQIERFDLHAGLSVPNYDDRSDEYIPAGTIVAIEPFASTGIGEVKSWKRSNIYRYLRKRSHLKSDQQKALREIEEHCSRLPFSERWLSMRVDRGSRMLNGLVRAGAVYAYPILREKSGGIVSQTEHTLYVTEKGCKVLTL
jgi:methionyl aminopeptidase